MDSAHNAIESVKSDLIETSLQQKAFKKEIAETPRTPNVVASSPAIDAIHASVTSIQELIEKMSARINEEADARKNLAESFKIKINAMEEVIKLGD